MPLVSDRSICLRKTEFSETSQILTLFTRTYGIVRLIAKGAHRRTKAGASKFDGGIDFLDLGQAVFSHDPARDLPFLAEWNLREGHLELRKTLRGIYLGLYAAELINRLIEEHDAHPDLFDRLEAVLPALATPRREEIFLAFELDLLRASGYLPELFACVSCGSAQDGRHPIYFSPRNSGIVCRNCEGSVPDRNELDIRLLRLLQTVLKLPRSNGAIVRLPQITRHQTDPINRMLADHVEQTLGKGMRMPKWVLGKVSCLSSDLTRIIGRNVLEWDINVMTRQPKIEIPLDRNSSRGAGIDGASLVPYEQRLSADLRWALSDASLFFEGKGSVQEALRKVVKRLDDLGIPYAVVGGLALFGHGYRRFTEDVDLLVTSDGLRRIHEQLEGLGYVPPFHGSKQLRDTELGVRIEFLVEGEFPGDGKPKPVAFPNPSGVAVEKNGIRYLQLPTLIDLKLASGMTNPRRMKDLVDVLELISALELPQEFESQLDPFVQAKFRELWLASQTPDPYKE